MHTVLLLEDVLGKEIEGSSGRSLGVLELEVREFGRAVGTDVR